MKGAEKKTHSTAPPPTEVRADETKTANLERLEHLINSFAERIESYDDTISSLGTKENYRLIAETNDFLVRGLSTFGIDPERTFQSLIINEKLIDHLDYRIRAPIPHFVLENIRGMLMLERQAPGAVRYLYENRGIRNFARYTVDFWQRQFEERDSTLPYMLVVVPSSVEKDALPDTTVYTALQQKLKKLNHPHIMRIIEIYDVPDALRLLVGLDKTYNAKKDNPIGLLLFDGHGNAERVFLHPGNQGGLFGVIHIQSERFEEVFKKYFIDAFASTAQFIFGSCDAARSGKSGSVAGELKAKLESIFSQHVGVAGFDDSVTAFSSLTPSFRDGVLSLSCKTSQKTKAQPRLRNL